MDTKQEPKYDVNEDGKLFNRVTGVIVPDDEPVFILRAKDKNAAPAIAFYRKLCENESHNQVVKERLHDFLDFTLDNPKEIKEPT